MSPSHQKRHLHQERCYTRGVSSLTSGNMGFRRSRWVPAAVPVQWPMRLELSRGQMALRKAMLAVKPLVTVSSTVIIHKAERFKLGAQTIQIFLGHHGCSRTSRVSWKSPQSQGNPVVNNMFCIILGPTPGCKTLLAHRQTHPLPSSYPPGEQQCGPLATLPTWLQQAVLHPLL